MSVAQLDTLSPQDWENIYISLSLRKNLIQTGDVSIDLAQAAREKRPTKFMSSEQMQLVLRTETLMNICLTKMSESRVKLNL